MKTIPYLFCSIILLISSCYKEPVSNQAKPMDPAYYNGKKFLASTFESVDTDWTKIPVDSGILIVGQNIKVSFLPGAFKDNDSLPYHDYASIRHYEKLYSKHEKVLSGKNLMGYYDGILQYSLVVDLYYRTWLGWPLFTQPGTATVQCKIDEFSQPLSLYKGDYNTGGASKYENALYSKQVVCENDSLLRLQYASALTMATCDSMYTFPFEHKGTVTLARPLSADYPNRAYVGLTIPDEYEPRYTSVYIMFEDLNAVANLDYRYDLCNCYELNGIYGVPTGLNATIIALTYKDGQWFSSFTPINLTGAYRQKITFSPTTLQDYKNAVLAL